MAENDEKMKVEQITETNSFLGFGKTCHLKKNVIHYVNSAIGVLGPPGAGKSSLCCAFYKLKYDMDNNYFAISDSNLTFTKGIWILKESERMKIKKNIDRDILDCEGFQADKIETWKYIMILSFICSEIIILDRNPRADETKKILNIIKNSLKQMSKSQIPKLLRNIFIQMTSKKKVEPSYFKSYLTQIGYESGLIGTVKISPIFIPTIDEDTLGENNDNILQVKKYLSQVKITFDNLPCSTQQSISTLIKHIDNLNKTLDGKVSFDSQEIIKELKDEYDNCYQSWYNKRKNELLKEQLIDIDSLQETFDEFIEKQNLNFSFEQKLEDLTFYNSSEEFDQYYESFGKDYTFKVDRNIFQDIYDSKRNQKESEVYKLGTEMQKEESKLLNYFEKQKSEINRYFGKLQFYDYIDEKDSHCNMDIFTDLNDEKNKLLKELYSYYEKKKKKKKEDWELQIKRAKYKSVCQTQGELKCKNGHKLNSDPIKCGGKCDGTLYWIDGPTHYSICINCNKISKCDSCICSDCKAETLCTPKFTDYIP